MTLSRADDSVPCAFQERRADGRRLPDCNVMSPASKMPCWVGQVMEEIPEPLRPLVSELSVVPLPASTPEGVQKYGRGILTALFELQITRVKADKMSKLQRLDPGSEQELIQQVQRELMMLEMERRALRSDA